ncbi:MAG: response regulator [Deltaproteobacteria bacterium]|nr:response regulator [Deltaproteobacteria bacterium]
MDFIICFIDDSDFEHELVRDEIAPRAEGMKFVQAYTFDEARRLLGKRIPVIFLLDLWGQDPEVSNPAIPPIGDLEKRVSRIKSLGEVYKDLDSFEGDRVNEYLRRLFSIVEAWRSIFRESADLAGQNRKYGLENLRRAREHYPGVPAVFYTRKSMIDDAVELFKAGADGLFIKPTGQDDRETRELTRESAPSLIGSLSRTIDLNFGKLQGTSDPASAIGEKESQSLRDLIKAWKEFRNN